MTDRTMRPALLVFALAVLGWAPRADAQALSGNLTIYIQNEDGEFEKLKNGSNVYINKRQCAADWRIEIQGYSVTVPTLELWTSNNQNTNCADQANRNSVNASQTICWGPKASGNQINGKATFTINGKKLFSRDEEACDEVKGTKYKIQFVTLESPTQTGTATVSASNNNPNQVSGIFTLYTATPSAPQNAKASSGGTTIGISWDKINNDPLTQYRAFFDHDPSAPIVMNMDAGAPEMCGTGELFRTTMTDAGTVAISGDDLNFDAGTLFSSGKTKGSKVSISDLDQKGIAVNTYTQVAVAAIDGAGNVGTLSKPVCVLRADTWGYLDRCRSDAGADCGDLESCSLSPRNTGSAFWLSACTLALSAWARRRRRSI